MSADKIIITGIEFDSALIGGSHRRELMGLKCGRELHFVDDPGRDPKMTTNNAPNLQWRPDSPFPGDQRLFSNGSATRYFVRTAEHIGHRTYGEKYGLYGCGMEANGTAAVLGFGPKMGPIKHRAEQLALQALDGNQDGRGK